MIIQDALKLSILFPKGGLKFVKTWLLNTTKCKKKWKYRFKLTILKKCMSLITPNTANTIIYHQLYLDYF